MARKTFRLSTLFSARCLLPDPPRYVNGIIHDIGIPDGDSPGLLCGGSLGLFGVKLTRDTTLHLRIALPDRDIEVDAVVCSVHAGEKPGELRYGIAFINLVDDDRVCLEDWLVAHALEVEFPAAHGEPRTCADSQFAG